MALPDDEDRGGEVIIIGVDPGLRTGISVVQVSENLAPDMLGSKVVDYMEAWTPSVGKHLRDTVVGGVMQYGVDSLDSDIRLVVERFVPEARKVDTTALEVIGELRAAKRNRVEWADKITHWHWPQRSEKESVTGDVLRRLDLWVKGHDNRHINDASRHVVTQLSKMGHRPTLEKGWPQ